ncbi:MAG: DUF3472 domain-containing protein [Rubripirellula sp.]
MAAFPIRFLLAALPLMLGGHEANADSPLRIPASTCYGIPDEAGVRISQAGVTHWKNPDLGLRWHGHFKATGSIAASVTIRAKRDATVRLSLAIDDAVQEAEVVAMAGDECRVAFKSSTINHPGYHAFTLRTTDDPPNCDVIELELEGPSVTDAHFNLNPRRNAASVHLAYPISKQHQASAFYCEMKAVEDPIWSYYMACGWHRGYFGMQVNSPTERRIIFSVWDSGGEPTERDRVADENRVQLVDKCDDVYSGDFGNEGTGGHSHLKYNWKTGEVQRFLVTAEPIGEMHTIFAGYYFHPDKKDWLLISSWKAPKEGKRLRGLYSFSENFVGKNGNLLRKAFYGNQWIRTSTGRWIEVRDAKFSHDATGKSDRLDRFMGIEQQQFFLAHGGFIEGFTDYGKLFTRPATGRSPADMNLPPLPPVIDAE